jgi:hypothetical protein
VFAGYIIDITCFTYVLIMIIMIIIINPVVSSTNIGAVKVVSDLMSQILNVKS